MHDSVYTLCYCVNLLIMVDFPTNTNSTISLIVRVVGTRASLMKASLHNNLHEWCSGAAQLELIDSPGNMQSMMPASEHHLWTVIPWLFSKGLWSLADDNYWLSKQFTSARDPKQCFFQEASKRRHVRVAFGKRQLRENIWNWNPRDPLAGITRFRTLAWDRQVSFCIGFIKSSASQQRPSVDTHFKGPFQHR